ncbi:hypothetical protein WN982_29695 [Paraburkholderia sp. IMGN_8]|uniref:hypothetical protein n=1 Tax=Paraburkholderia sp. IMGN_8 TaxID=3136564 RepID=UPI0031011B04
MPIAFATPAAAFTALPALIRRSLPGAALISSLCAAPLAYSADPAAAPPPAGAAAIPAAASAATAGDDTFLLTVFLRHDESRPLPKINDQLRAQGFFKTFPPPGIEVVSWYVMMGIGQVVTLRVPASRLREVNRAIETTAWGGYRTEFYPTYDYKAQAQQMRAMDGK